MKRKLTPVQWAAIIVVHVMIASYVWHDLSHRPDDQVRGPKWMWRIASALNSGNSVIYLLVGRKRVNSGTT